MSAKFNKRLNSLMYKFLYLRKTIMRRIYFIAVYNRLKSIFIIWDNLSVRKRVYPAQKRLLQILRLVFEACANL